MAFNTPGLHRLLLGLGIEIGAFELSSSGAAAAAPVEPPASPATTAPPPPPPPRTGIRATGTTAKHQAAAAPARPKACRTATSTSSYHTEGSDATDYHYWSKHAEWMGPHNFRQGKPNHSYKQNSAGRRWAQRQLAWPDRPTVHMAVDPSRWQGETDQWGFENSHAPAHRRQVLLRPAIRNVQDMVVPKGGLPPRGSVAHEQASTGGPQARQEGFPQTAA
eukprot:7175729-Heterocapsa_arctica.AAC.1